MMKQPSRLLCLVPNCEMVRSGADTICEATERVIFVYGEALISTQHLAWLECRSTYTCCGVMMKQPSRQLCMVPKCQIVRSGADIIRGATERVIFVYGEAHTLAQHLAWLESRSTYTCRGVMMKQPSRQLCLVPKCQMVRSGADIICEATERVIFVYGEAHTLAQHLAWLECRCPIHLLRCHDEAALSSAVYGAKVSNGAQGCRYHL